MSVDKTEVAASSDQTIVDEDKSLETQKGIDNPLEPLVIDPSIDMLLSSVNLNSQGINFINCKPVRMLTFHNLGRKFAVESATGIQRSRVLLQLLETRRVLEFSVGLAEELRMYISSGSGSYGIDKRTVHRTAQKLESHNLLKIIIVRLPTVGGGQTNKTLYLHRTSSPEDQQVKDIIAKLHDRPFYFTQKPKLQRVNVESGEVESIQDLKSRIGMPDADETAPRSLVCFFGCLLSYCH
jgi:hypothetical protein